MKYETAKEQSDWGTRVFEIINFGVSPADQIQWLPGKTLEFRTSGRFFVVQGKSFGR
jgi:hypothetical protein